MAKKWADYTPRQLKRAVTPLWLAILALWAYQNSSPTPEEPYVSAQVAQFHAQWLEQRGVSDAYVSFNQLWALAMQIQQQFVPISAIVGGVAAQECIKAISGKEMPLNNTFILDGTESTGILHHITL
ncbi:E1 ubiquitin-activating protein aos1 [Dimargaris xerosporica]|nr:E1 ubiquitin-activating protein aos1 [Dimargaris xerosporica]